MGYRAQNNYDAAKREPWRKLPWGERYSWCACGWPCCCCGICCGAGDATDFASPRRKRRSIKAPFRSVTLKLNICRLR